ncbi:MAG TPA: PD-(D/E)XK nuclease family protein [Pseudogracilibacillus sp.]|nr:PD-(D/E)XK nuclease family protein [Pseudogracilibacillus sp.]
MKQWMERLKTSANSFGEKKIVIIPRKQMRQSFERTVLKEIPAFMQVSFMTFYEWILSVTSGYRYRHNIREISRMEQVQFIFNALQQIDESVLTTEQKNLATAEAILEDMTLIRLNELDGHVMNKRMKETVTALINTYEAYLQEKKLYDYASLLALITRDESLLEQVKQAAKQCQISIYPNEELSKQEVNLVESLGFHKLKEMTGEANNPQVTSLMSYGFANGMDHLLQAVVDKEIASDELCIVYTDSSQLPSIQQAIERRGLAATYAEGISLANTETYAFFKTLIEYVYSGRPLHLFRKLVDAGQITIQEVGNAGYLFKRLMETDGMTFGARFYPLAKHALEEALEKGMPDYLIKHEDAIRQIMDGMAKLEADIEQLLAGDLRQSIEMLLHISDTLYRKNSQNIHVEYKVMKATFESFTEYDLDVDLQAILEMIKGQNIHQATEKPGHIHVISLDNIGLVYRQHYAWFGLATDEFKVKTNRRSPFISEDNLIENNILTDVDYFKIVENRLERFVKQSNAHHRLYFNYFNTSDIREKNPIALWTEFAAEKPHIIGYPIKGVQDENRHGLLEKLSEDFFDKDKFNLKVYRFSPSSAVDLKACSRKFMYEKMMEIKLPEFSEFSHQNWLPNNILGNLYHRLLESYEQESKQGEVVLDELIEAVFNDYASRYPAYYEKHVIDEKQRAEKIMARHIATKEAAWEMLFVEKNYDIEINFTEDEYGSDDALENIQEHTFEFRGIMDRIDFNEANKEYMITDYKTNRSNNADTLQLIVYEKMLREKYEDAGNIASQFDYIFQEKTNKLSDVKSDKKIENVKSFLTAFKDFSHNWDNVEFLGDKSPCKYCRFQSLCKIREGEKND